MKCPKDNQKIEDYVNKHVMSQDDKEIIGNDKNKLIYYILRVIN